MRNERMFFAVITCTSRAPLQIVVQTIPRHIPRYDSLEEAEEAVCVPLTWFTWMMDSKEPDPICFFQGCANEAAPNSWRCQFHRGRGRCSVPNCPNQAYARKLCARHGGKRQCQFEGCQFRARVANYCSQHGIKRPKKQCQHEGCVDAAQSKGLCVKHGGGRRCKLEGCQTFARRGGYCARHSTSLQEKQVETHELDPNLLVPLDDEDQVWWQTSYDMLEMIMNMNE